MDPRKFVDFASADDFLEGFMMLHFAGPLRFLGLTLQLESFIRSFGRVGAGGLILISSDKKCDFLALLGWIRLISSRFVSLGGMIVA